MQKIRLVGVGNVPNLRRLILIDADAVTTVFRPAEFVAGIQENLAENQQVVVSYYPVALGSSELPDPVIDLYFVPGTGTLVASKTAAGYNTTISIEVPSDFAEVAETEFRLVNRKWIGITEDNNGLPRLVGTKKQPLRMVSEYNSASRSRVFSFSAVTYESAYYLRNSVLSDGLLPNGGFSLGFSNGFAI